MQSKLNKIFTRLAANQELLSHSLKTAHLCWEAIQLLPRGFIQMTPGEMYLAGLLHDLGKTSWPEELFWKPKDKLSKLELGRMNQHPIEGSIMAMKMLPDLSDEVYYIIATHHERPDGTGYPAGLKELTNETLLLATCDVFCACTEPRQYRKGILATNDTLKIIEKFAPAEIIEAIIIGQNKAGRVVNMNKITKKF